MKPVYFLLVISLFGMLTMGYAMPGDAMKCLKVADPCPADSPCEPCPTDTTSTPNRPFLSGRDIWGVVLPYGELWSGEADKPQTAADKVDKKKCVNKEEKAKAGTSYLRPPFMLR